MGVFLWFGDIFMVVMVLFKKLIIFDCNFYRVGMMLDFMVFDKFKF